VISRNGSGNYTLPGASFPSVFNTVITETDYNANLTDIAAALTASIANDGQTTITANLPMNSKKLTGLAAGSSSGDSVEYAQFLNDYNKLRSVNPIINGAFTVWQAGTSFAAPASLAYDADGWSNENTSAAVFTISRENANPTGSVASAFNRKLIVTTADAAVAAGDYVSQRTAIEGYNSTQFISKTFTIGFYVKSTKTGIHCLSVYDGTKSYVTEYTVTASNTWEFKQITIVGGLQTTASQTNSAGVYLFFTNMAGTTYQTTAGAWNTGFFAGTANQVNDMDAINNVFHLGEVTMCLGTSAITYQMTYEEELKRCKRYFQTFIMARIFSGDATNLGTYYGAIVFPVEMRTTPSITGTSTATVGFPVVTGTITINDGKTAFESRVANATAAGSHFGSIYTLSARL